ncbi:MAG TPA: hypothetical protein VM899_06335 [Rubellimicrobium sp.]|nr:hypothetical protein [Rubellimicrobium sp.]
MSRHVLIIDRDPARRTSLRRALDRAAAEVTELDDPARLPLLAANGGAEIALLDLDLGDAALDALRGLRHGPAGQVLPVIALVPPDRPDLRLAALLAGAEEATGRDTAPRILQARIRSLLRDRDAALPDASETAFPTGEPPARPRLAEAPVAFFAAPSRGVAVPRLRLGLLTPDGGPGSRLLDGLGRLLDA